MSDEFRLAEEAENVEFQAYSRHFEHPGEEDEPARRAVLFVVATMSFPDSGWAVRIVPVEGTQFEEWMLLEDPPGYGDKNRTYVITSGSSEHEIDNVPETIKVRYGDEINRVSVQPWD